MQVIRNVGLYLREAGETVFDFFTYTLYGQLMNLLSPNQLLTLQWNNL